MDIARGSSLDDCCRQEWANFSDGIRPISVGWIPMKGRFSSPSFVVPVKFRSCRAGWLMSCGDRSGLLVRRFPTTTVQAGEYCDRKPCVQIHCPFRQHGPAAFITNCHGSIYHVGKLKHIHLKYWVFTGNGPSGQRQIGHSSSRYISECGSRSIQNSLRSP